MVMCSCEFVYHLTGSIFMCSIIEIILWFLLFFVFNLIGEEHVCNKTLACLDAAHIIVTVL